VTIELFDRRTGRTRRIDAPLPLLEELSLSVWHGKARDGHWTHEIYRRTHLTGFEFIGTATDDPRPPCPASTGPAFVTVPWPEGVRHG